MAEEEHVHKRVLYRCRGSLVDDMDFDSMHDYLISKEIFPPNKMRDIKDEPKTSERIRQLVDAVAGAGPGAYDTFLEGLKYIQRHLYNKLKTEEKKLGGNKIKTTKQRTPQGNQVTSMATDSAAQMSLQHGERDKPDGSTERSTNIDSARPDEIYKRTMQQPMSATSCGDMEGNNIAQTLTDSSQMPSSSSLSNENLQRQEPTPSNIADGSSVLSANTLGQEVAKIQSSRRSGNARSDIVAEGAVSKPIDPLANQARTIQSTGKCKPRDVADGPTVEPEDQDSQDENPISFGNFTSYEDMHADDTAHFMPSIDKRRHYTEGAANQPSDASDRPDTDQQESDDKGVSHSQDQTDAQRLPPTQPHDSGSAVNPQQGTSSAAPNRPVTIRQEAGDNGMQHSVGLPDPPLSPSAQSRVAGPAINQIQQGIANLTTDESPDDYLFLKEHFDACVIYTQGNRNRAEEIVKDTSRLPEGFKVCHYDDEEYFGFFTPESQSSVIINHCVLILIVISKDIEEDKHAKHLRNTIAMAKQNSAQIRPVLFSKEEAKYIPASLSNTKVIPWYDKEKEYMKSNLLALLKQCKKFRKGKEKKAVKTQKDISH